LTFSDLSLFFCQEDDLSQKSIEWITGKIVLDAGFREALLADPDQTLAGFDLTDSEKASIKRLDSETMDLLAHTLADRVRRIRQVSPGIPLDLFSKKE
jgi:hypothetical protein